MLKLECAVQHYAWGKPGSTSVVAQLKGQNVDGDENKPFAEFWMGTHTNGPSKLVDKNVNLSDYINAHPSCVGAHEKNGIQYLFKVLSINKALSIQSHPNKEQARLLHKKDSKNYPDDNHKPEIAIALSGLEILCGFRVPHEILSNFKAHPELFELVNEDDLENLASEGGRAALKALFSSIWKSPAEKIASVVETIILKISKSDERQSFEELMLRLNSQYPGGDVGVLAPLFLNHFTLKPGQSTFIGPNEPHAYLFGDCIECMACSDNTIRAGLTPKFRDVETLCENLTYNMTTSPYLEPTEKLKGVFEYSPPVEEFAVQKINNEAIELNETGASSIIIIINGSALLNSESIQTELRKGDVWFIPFTYNSGLQLLNSTNDFLAFRAYTPIKPN